jgi:hypothetical protein
MKPISMSLISLILPVALCAQMSGQSGGAPVMNASYVTVLRARAKMDAARDAMIAGGRMLPSNQEVERGGWAMERGVTRAQITAIARSTEGDRSLLVAFDVLAKMTAHGVPAARAAAEVQANVTSGASDATLVALLTADASAANVHGMRRTAYSTAARTGDIPTLTTAVGGTLRRP